MPYFMAMIFTWNIAYNRTYIDIVSITAVDTFIAYLAIDNNCCISPKYYKEVPDFPSNRCEGIFNLILYDYIFYEYHMRISFVIPLKIRVLTIRSNHQTIIAHKRIRLPKS
jgi:hypothetical protein